MRQSTKQKEKVKSNQEANYSKEISQKLFLNLAMTVKGKKVVLPLGHLWDLTV